LQSLYVLYTTEAPGPKSLLFKLAALKNNETMRTKTVEEHRVILRRFSDIRPIPPACKTEPALIEGVPCEWITTPESRPDKVVVYLHGGSWIFGDLSSARPVGVLLAEMGDFTVLAVDYRLAPEHPFPAGLDDCEAVYRHLLEKGFPPDKIGLFGDSAGGNLSLCLLHRLREEGVPFPAAVACASPVTDLQPGSSMRQLESDLNYTRYKGEEWDIFSLYLAGVDPRDPSISPILGDMTGFPPILLHVGADEALCEDNVAFAEQACAQGVKVICKVWNGMYHDFAIVGVTLKESKESMLEVSAFFRKYMAR